MPGQATELIKPRGPWKTLADVELATAEWVDWYNERRQSLRPIKSKSLYDTSYDIDEAP